MEKVTNILSDGAHGASTPCMRRSALLGLPLLIAPFWIGNAIADHCEELAGEVVSVEGAVNVGKLPTSMGAEICSGEPISVGALSRAAIRLAATQTVVRIDQNSTFLIRPSDAESSWLELVKGVIYLFSRQPESLRVDTPYVNAAIDGTEFVVEASDEFGSVTVIEGSVLVDNAFGQVMLGAGEVASAGAGRSPQRRVVVDSIDAVQWALHYPPIGATEETSDAVRSAADLLARGDVERAESLLNEAPEDAASLALQAMIAVTQNRSLEALQLATKAVDADAGSSLAYTALSYAQQARFEIEQALTSANVAVRNNSRSGYALARQAELELGVDDPAAALRSARKAIEVAPDNSRARTVLGFVRLVRLEVGEAEAAFAEAVNLDPGDPLPRLGLGLATIRDGRLVEGREHLEVAAALDPNNALVRSYLGKAYAEERESGDAAAQFALAQALDPQDPTPWLYDALLDQVLNRPVSAYRKISRARALNDNRLVYRSRLLVDSDAAAQSISLARVYSELGFEQLAINQSSQSLATDPTNYSAYRFLADALEDRERQALARESVLFRSALLQPLTINPAQPEAQESDLLILPGSGPVSASDNEFNPLFDRDGFRLSGSLVYGNQKTRGNQLVLAAKKRKIAYSFGQFHYETDGFRQNNDLTHDLINLQVQYQPSPEFSLQADVRARETTSGDVLQSFDPNDLDPTNRLNIQTITPRIGMRYSPNRRTTVLASLRSLQRDEASRSIARTGFGTFIQAAELERDGLEPHLQLMLLGRDINHTLGVEGYHSTTRIARELELGGQPCGTSSGICTSDSGDENTRFVNGYYHSDFSFNDSLDLTLGASYTLTDEDGGVQKHDVTGPKIGLWWRVSPTVNLRTAFVGGMGRGSSSDVTLEPIVIAGFNHLFDDNFGARFQSFSIALDWNVKPGLSLGFESRLRALKVPITFDFASARESIVEDENQDEFVVRSFLYWLPSETDAVSASLSYERYDREVLNIEGSPSLAYLVRPNQTTAVILPVRWRHTRPDGYFAQSTVTLVHQKVDQSPLIAFGEVSDTFVDVEVSVGRKFAARRGSFRIDVRNIFDTDFSFQDQSFLSSERTSAPRFSTERTIYGRLSFFF